MTNIYVWWKNNYLPIVLLFGCALFLKFGYFFTHRNFSQDQVRDYLLIQNAWQTKNFYIPLGPATASADDLKLPPLYYYLQLLAQGVGKGYFYSMDILVILLESLTPILLFYLLQRCIRKKSTQKWWLQLSFWLSLLYLTSYQVIVFSTQAWNPSLMPFFSLLLIVAAGRFIFDHSNPALLIAILSLVVMVNLHFQWFVFVPAFIIILVIAGQRIRTTWPFLLWSLGLCLLIFAPYLYYESTHQLTNLQNALSLLHGNHGIPMFERISKIKFLTIFFPGFYARLLGGDYWVGDWQTLYKNLPLSINLIMSAIVFNCVALAASWNAWQQRQKNKWPLALILLFISMALMLRVYKGDKPDYFLLSFSSFFFIFLALASNWCQNKLSRSLFSLGVGLLFVLPIYALTHDRWRDDYGDFARLSVLAAAYPQDELIIVPLNQDLMTPLTFYFDSNQLARQPDPSKNYNLLVCFARMNCRNYTANQCSPKNYFTYNWVDFEDYSTYFPNLNFSTVIVDNQTLQAVLIEQN